ncbi:glycosyltransferase family 4 protein [bacterium]|nr:glycosyltransferase family 4 protein [bacterium]MBP9809281.1 glycosyltransferase family 4 protein [bacterium]
MSKKLHIALVMRLFSSQGGLELYALKLVEGLLGRDHKVTVFCEIDESNLSHANLVVQKFAGPKKGCNKWQKIEHYRKVASEAVDKAGPFDIVHSQHFPINSGQLDAVTFHNHTAGRLSLVGYPVEKLLNSFKMATAKNYKLRHKYDLELCQKAHMRIFVATVMKDDFYNTYQLNPAAPFAIAPPGASLAHANHIELETEQTTSESQEPFTFLFVGKGMRKKGLDTLFKACSILKKRKLDFRLLIAGLSKKPLQKFDLINLGISSNVEFLGYQKDMISVFNNAKALVLPSKIEPFGMAPIQAMQYGLVPIVSKVCGVAEVLSDNNDALILQNHLSATELADLMTKLMGNLELYKKLSKQARLSAQSISWKKTVQATEEAYQRIMQAKKIEPLRGDVR